MEKEKHQVHECFYFTNIRFVKDSCCYNCGLPGDMCPWYKDEMKCKSMDIVIPTCLVAFLCQDSDLWNVIKSVSVRSFSMESFCNWLIGKATVLGKNTINAFALFEGILKKRKEEEENSYF